MSAVSSSAAAAAVDGPRGGILRCLLLPRLPVKRKGILSTLKAISVGPVRRMTHGWRLGGMMRAKYDDSVTEEGKASC